MEAKTKRNIIIWAIIVLVLLNISSLGTIWYHRYQFKKQRSELKDRRFEGRRPAGKQAIRQRPPYMFRELDLSEDQKKNLDSIWQHFNGQRKILEDSMDNNRIRMFGVMMDEKLDTARYEELSENQANLIRELNDTMLAMNRQIRANLSEGQQKVLTEKMQEIRTRRMPRERRNRRSK